MTPRPWKIPQVWPGERCYILGGGPSLPVAELPALRSQRVIAVNNAYKVAPWADVMIFGDSRWYKEHGAGLLDFAGLKVTTAVQWAKEAGLRWVRKELMPFGVTTDPCALRWNLSTGACALNLAASLGACEIVLLGFDMKRAQDGSSNFHTDYRPQRNNPYPRFLRPFPAIKRDLDKLGVRVFNATPDSALTVWPSVTLGEVMLQEIGERQKEPQGEPNATHPVEEVASRPVRHRELAMLHQRRVLVGVPDHENGRPA